MPGQAPVRTRPLSGELLPSLEEGAWLPDPIAAAAARKRGGPEAAEARLFGWSELLGTWVEHLMTAIDVAVLGEHVPTVLALVDRNDAKSRWQVEALRRFKCGVKDAVRVFVLYSHEFGWLFEAWEIKELPTLLLFGVDGAENRADNTSSLGPAELVEVFSSRLSVDLAWAKFPPEPLGDEGYSWPRRQIRKMWKSE